MQSSFLDNALEQMYGIPAIKPDALIRETERMLILREMRKRDFYRLLRGTVPRLIDSWFYESLTNKLMQFFEDVKNQKSPRLILTVPPRHLKSETCSVRFPLWCMLQRPRTEIICCSYSQELSNEFSLRARNVLVDNYVSNLWPNVHPASSDFKVSHWSLSNGSSYKSVGMGGSITGTGADILIIDDPYKNLEQAYSESYQAKIEAWYRSVAVTRLSPGGGVIVVQTRWTKTDLVNYLLEKDEAKKSWKVVSYPVIAQEDEEFRKEGEPLVPGRFSLQQLADIREDVGEKVYESLYLCNPSIAGGDIFKTDWFKEYDELPAGIEQWIQSWDMRFGKNRKKGSFVCGQVWARKGANIYLVDQARGRWDFVQSCNQFNIMVAKYPQAFARYVERKANGEALESQLRETVPGIIMVDPRGDKIQRAYRSQPICESGNVYLPKNNPYITTTFKNELTSFPDCKNDDQVDAFTQAVDKMFLYKDADIIYATPPSGFYGDDDYDD